ncbi:metallophosphoesterase [Pectinatus sottacetonis]|uniref:metallophosphoesterase n=1 Tax=Pectinatus sottacetonis TaxID=1002795 RepID=UPI0018C5CE1E|nr:metallophosphoesterase [Pectinatus sottacetonis]
MLLPIEGVVLYGSFVERNDIIVKKYNIKMANAGTWSGLKIAHLTDAHVGSFFSLEKLNNTLKHLAAMNADILAVTGDIFDDDVLNVQAVKILGKYVDKFTYGIYFCWGNHEYMHNMKNIKMALNATAIKVLDNRCSIINKNGEKLCLMGVDYPHDRSKFQQQAQIYMKKAVKNAPDSAIKILLAHHSDFIDNGFEYHINLTLTGHTHGGQIGIFGKPLFLGFKYVRGMFRKGYLYGYVSTGAGSWFPFRIGCPPEITLFTLV